MPCCEPTILVLIVGAASVGAGWIWGLFQRRKRKAVERGPCPETGKAECYCPK